MKNMDIRAAIEKSGFRQWEVAEAYGRSEGVFSRMLRHELPESTKTRIYQAIEGLKRGDLNDGRE